MVRQIVRVISDHSPIRRLAAADGLYRRGRLVAAFAGARGGAMAVTIALMMTMFGGMLGLAIDLADWYSARRAMQTAVDAAALGGAVALYNGDTSAQITSAATTDGDLNSIGPAASGTTLTINVSMANETVTATMTKTADLLFSGLFLSSAPTISVTAEAGIIGGGAAPCLLVTNPSASGAITLSGSSSIQASGCPIVVNSTSSTAINISGATSINSSSICGPGGASVAPGSKLNPAETTCPAGTDPLANLTPPSNINNACDYTNYQITNNNVGSYVNAAGQTVPVNASGGGTITMQPGIYCNGVSLSGNSGQSNVIMEPGIYIMRDGQFETGNNSTVSGTGVGIWLTGQGSGINISNGNGSTNLTITAPTSGPMEGIAIYQDQSEATGTVTEGLAGNSTITFTGVLYFGNQNVTVNGSSEDKGASYTSMVAYTLTYNGYSTLYLNSNYKGSVPLPPAYTSKYVGLLE